MDTAIIRPSAGARAGFVYLLTLIVIVVVSSLAVVMARGASIRLRAGPASGDRPAAARTGPGDDHLGAARRR